MPLKQTAPGRGTMQDRILEVLRAAKGAFVPGKTLATIIYGPDRADALGIERVRAVINQIRTRYAIGIEGTSGRGFRLVSESKPTEPTHRPSR
jgi:hypothetical protein